MLKAMMLSDFDLDRQRVCAVLKSIKIVTSIQIYA